MVVRLPDISSKMAKKHKKWIFCLFLSLCWTASPPYRLSPINALRIIQFYKPKDQSMRFSQKNIENWQSWKMTFFWVGHFEFFSSKKIFFFPMKISHKLCVRIDGTQFSILWWFTAKNKGGNHEWAWVYLLFGVQNLQCLAQNPPLHFRSYGTHVWTLLNPIKQMPIKTLQFFYW